MNEFVYNDYANWLIENDNLIKTLKKEKTQLYDRYENVFLVVEHLYDLKVEQKPFSEDYYKIFTIGFHYLFNQFENVKLLLDNTYDGSLKELLKYETSIVLFLMAGEFQDDIYDSLKEEADEIIKPIKNIENEIYEYITKKQHVPKKVFDKLDKKTLEIYNEHEQIYNPIYSIFYDIAEEMNLVK